jgi:carbon monoxide dehydrogenase subunit G
VPLRYRTVQYQKKTRPESRRHSYLVPSLRQGRAGVHCRQAMNEELIPIHERAELKGSVGEVWPLLADPAAVVKCIPGASLDAEGADGVYPATITVKFGPTIATFSGEVKTTYDHDAHRCQVDGRGIDGRGASNALVSVTVSLEGNEHAVLDVDGGFSVSGPLETFASAGGVHVARALLGEFAANIAKMTSASRAAPPAPDAPAPAEKPLSGGKLLWRAFLSWLKQLINGKDERSKP